MMRLPHSVRLLTGGALLIGAATAHAQQRPDFSGIWQAMSPSRTVMPAQGNAPPLKPAFAKVYMANQAKLKAGDLSFDPVAKCVSPGMPRALTLPYPFQIVQGSRKVAFIFQWNYWNRLVDLSTNKRNIEYPLANGFAKGRFQGDALIVESIGFRPDTLLDSAGLPHGENLKVDEEYRLADDGKTLEDKITFTDPEVFTRPWTTVLKFRRLPPGTEIAEDVCLDRIDAGKPAIEWSSQR